MRSYKPLCVVQAIQARQTLYLVDTLKLGQPQSILQDRQLLKITSEVTPTGQAMQKVVEVNSPLRCVEALFNGIDLRARPLGQDVCDLIKEDFDGI